MIEQAAFNRLADEQAELLKKLYGIVSFLDSDECEKLSKADKTLLIQQSSIMLDYYRTIERRVDRILPKVEAG
jgi:hypothetical protein